MKNVLLAIQARSTSTRLPGKCNMRLGGTPMLMWVVNACRTSARFLEEIANVAVVVLAPHNDPIASIYGSDVEVLEGDEQDVLSRYAHAQRHFNSDYVVRITSDCPHIPSHHITKHVRAAIFKTRDYTTNTVFRTFKEGWDCEVLSASLLQWLDEHATSDYDREHVTTHLRDEFPFTFSDGLPSICHIIQHIDESHIKTSIDTKEEFDAAEAMFQSYRVKKNAAMQNGIIFT